MTSEVPLPVNMAVGLISGHMTNSKRTHVVLAEQLVKEIDALVGSRQRSRFLTEAAEKELMRRRQIQALMAATGAWKDRDHPELEQGSREWVRKLRRESEHRLRKSVAG